VIRAIIIAFLLFLVLNYEGELADSVSEKTERQHLVQVVEHSCKRIADLPDEMEECQQAGLRAVERLASTEEWAWREKR
jgi:hypothetical protein